MSGVAFVKTTGKLSGTVLGVLAFIFNEALIIYIVHRIGPWWTTLLYTVVFGFLSLLLFQWFEHAAQTNNWVGRLVRWFIGQAAAWRIKYARLVETSGLLAITAAAIFAGAFVSTILTGILGYTGRRAQVMILIEAFLPAFIWSLFYSGLLRLIFGH